MRERPILFSAPMVRAILDGRKTQTRRVVKTEIGKGGIALVRLPNSPNLYDYLDFNGKGLAHASAEERAKFCPYGAPGDQLWVRETWASDEDDLEKARAEHEDALARLSPIYYRADEVHEDTGLRWRPSIHMPRWASRITLEVTGVRVERLHDIGEHDARAEGVTPLSTDVRHPTRHRLGFEKLWEKINGRDSWLLNPWVWVVEFKRVAP